MNSNWRAMSAHRATKCSPRRSSGSSGPRSAPPRGRPEGRRAGPAGAAGAACPRRSSLRPRLGRERVARVGAADVRADRAAEAVRVLGVVAEVVVLGELGPVRPGATGQRRAARPAADHPRRQAPCARPGPARRPGVRVAASANLQKPPTSWSRRAHHEVAAVAAEVVRVLESGRDRAGRGVPGRAAPRAARRPGPRPRGPAASGSTGRARWGSRAGTPRARRCASPAPAARRPAMVGWERPSRKPKCSPRPMSEVSRHDDLAQPAVGEAETGARRAGPRGRPRPWRRRAAARATSGPSGPPQVQCAGAAAPSSPSSRLRCALVMPSRNSRENPAEVSERQAEPGQAGSGEGEVEGAPDPAAARRGRSRGARRAATLRAASAVGDLEHDVRRGAELP